MSQLCNDVVGIIVSFLGIRELMTCEQVSKEWRDLVKIHHKLPDNLVTTIIKSFHNGGKTARCIQAIKRYCDYYKTGAYCNPYTKLIFSENHQWNEKIFITTNQFGPIVSKENGCFYVLKDGFYSYYNIDPNARVTDELFSFYKEVYTQMFH